MDGSGELPVDATGKENSAAPRRCILVLGMHRSGTSALTRVLSFAGARLPADLMGAGEGNEFGHWEPARLVEYHDKLLAELGSHWDDWRRLELRRLPARRRMEIKTEISGQLSADYDDARLIVVKDPRICRFAPLFLDALDDAGFEARVALCIRNPLEVAASLEARASVWSPYQSQTTATLLWLRHVLDAEAATRGRIRTIVSYDGLLADWVTTFARLTDQLGLSWSYGIDEIAPRVLGFLAPQQRHHRRSADDVVLDPATRGWISDAFEALLVLERNPISAPALATLDRIRREFDSAAPVIARALEEAHNREDARVAALETALAESKDRGAALAADLKRWTSEAGRYQALLAEREADVGQLGTALAAAEEEAAALAARLAEQDAETRRARAELTEVTERAAVRQQQLLAALAEKEGALLRATTSIDALRSAHEAERKQFTAALAEADARSVPISGTSVGRRTEVERPTQQKPGVLHFAARCMPKKIGRRLKSQRDVYTVSRSGHFDINYYLDENPDVKAAGINPIQHYLAHGAREGRNPSPSFDTNWYLAENADVRRSSMNPLLHYIRHGSAEGRATHAAASLPNTKAGRTISPTSRIVRLRHIRKAVRDFYEGPRDRTRIAYTMQLLQKYTTAWLEQRAKPAQVLEDAVTRADVLRFVQGRRLNAVVDPSLEPSVNIILPTLDASIIFGGYISLFHFARFLQEAGFQLRIVIAEYLKGDISSAIAGCDRAQPFVSEVLRSSKVTDCTNDSGAPIAVSSDDLFVAYNCNCSQIAYNTIKDWGAGPHIFYIQEEEGHFHSHNSFRAYCESIYGLPYFGIYNSPQLVKYFEMLRIGSFSPDAMCKEHISYRHALVGAKLPSQGDLAARTRRRLLFFSRPERHAERNLFETGVNALREACAQGMFPQGSWELHAIGSGPFDPLPLPGNQKLVFIGKLPIAEYAKRLSEYDVGLSLMFAPHPSVPNLELAAAGVPTVTTTFVNRDKHAMESISRNLIAVMPTVDALTAGLAMARQRSFLSQQRLENAEFDWPRCWSDSFDTRFQANFISKLELVYGAARVARLRKT